MVWLDYLLSIWCRGLLLTGATAFSSQLLFPSPQAILLPTIPQSLGIALSPGSRVISAAFKSCFRQLLEDLFLSDYLYLRGDLRHSTR